MLFLELHVWRLDMPRYQDFRVDLFSEAKFKRKKHIGVFFVFVCLFGGYFPATLLGVYVSPSMMTWTGYKKKSRARSEPAEMGVPFCR